MNVYFKACCLVTQMYLTLCDLMDCSPPGSSVHGILQATILEWVAMSFSRGSSWPRNCTQISCNDRQILDHWVTREGCILKLYTCSYTCVYIVSSIVQFSHSVVSDSSRPHGLQHARPPCPSPTPRPYSNSCPSSWWCHPTISSSVVPFSSCVQFFQTLWNNPVWSNMGRRQ